MKYCDICKITVRTSQELCPLCQGELHSDGHEEAPVFPKVTYKKSVSTAFLKWTLFSSVILILICLFINWIVSPDCWWSGFVASGTVIINILLKISIKKKNNPLKSILWQVVLLSLALIIWDFALGWQAWSITYVFPIGMSIAIITIIIVALAKKMSTPEFMIYLILSSIIGLIPAILAFSGLTTQKIPSFICGMLAVLLLAGLLIFRFRDFFEELVKKFHL